ncbi:DinB family protein [Kribbella pratensis]|uniref:DinB family protein n=1 Tax=Kribbella pratensis TaxID=2512112 RepID=A0ABY2FKW2_9ACTN|nr:DinB family protein [Kribbella pratensis]TDW93412.1 DinB family protein [Kribbella pratensis]
MASPGTADTTEGSGTATAWCSVVAAQYRSTLDDLAIVLRGCPDALWEASIYEVKKTDQWAWPPTDRDGQPFDDPAVREYKLQASSAVWRTASHALWFTDLDLSTTETDWAPPAPFSRGDEDGYVVPPTYSRDQVFAYIDRCRRKVDTLFADLTDDQAAAHLAEPHRNGGTSLAAVLVQGVVHLQLHSTQIRTFLRSHGIRCEDE